MATKKKWKEIDLTSENPEIDSFASIGNGCIRISRGACRLIENFEECNYVSFQRAKKDRIYFLGIKFRKNKVRNSIPFHKGEDKIFGATIAAESLVHTFYGYEGIDKDYTKHSISLSDEDPNVIIIFYNYKNKYFEEDDEEKKKPVRTRHIGQILNDEWRVMSSKAKSKTRKYPIYILKNINTGEKIELSIRALIDIERGQTSVENIKKCREVGTASWLGKKRAEKKKRLKAIDDINGEY